MTQAEICQDLFHLLTISYRFSEDIAQSIIIDYLEQAEGIRNPRAWCLRRARWLFMDIQKREARCVELAPNLYSTENPFRRVEARQRLDRFAQLMGDTYWAEKADYLVLIQG